MKLPRLNSHRMHLPIVFSLAGLTITAAVFVTVAAFSANGFSAGAASSVVSHAVFDEVQIQLGANGFTPSEVQHAAGTFGIVVDNSALSGEYTLRLTAADGTIVKEIEVQKGSAAWTMTLAAGEYTLTEASHSDWSCRITLQ